MVDVELTEGDGIAVLTLNRPEARNGLTAELLAAFVEAVRSITSGSARALVLTGAGPSFCGGGDLRAVKEAAASGQYETLGRLVGDLQDTIRLLRSLPIPVVAAVEGAAAGAGLGLAMAADLRVLGRSSVFVPGYLAIGVSPDAGVSYSLARMLGGPQALAAMIRNRRLSAPELAAAGIADEIVDDGQALPAARKLASEVAGAAPHALVATRRLIDLATTHGLDPHLDAEAESIRTSWNNGEFAEGARAFLERRAAQFAPLG